MYDIARADDITEFVKKIFELYKLNKYTYFYDYDDESEEVREVPLLWGNMDDSLGRLEICLGMSKEDIYNMNSDAALVWWRKYDFFKLYHEYLAEWVKQSNYAKPLNSQQIIIKAIFGDDTDKWEKDGYNYKAVIARLKEQLKEMDKLLPGTYHENAEITELNIRTRGLSLTLKHSKCLKHSLK